MNKLNRRQFIAASGAAAASATVLPKISANTNVKRKASTKMTKSKAKPNILWIMTDEQRPDSLGCYGSKWAKTPNLDRLAANGTAFTQCHTQSPVCVPSRASTLACRYPQDVNVYDNKYYFEDGIMDPSLKTFPEIFADAGYKTASIGKWHTPNHPTWQENIFWQHYGTIGMYGLGDKSREKPNRVVKRLGGSSIILAGTYPHDNWGANSASHLTDLTIDWIKNAAKSDQPFMLRLSHLWPHTPVLPPSPWHKLYEPDEIPYNLDEYKKTLDKRSKHDLSLGKGQRGMEFSEETWRWIRQCYYGLCAYVDNQVGRLLNLLDELGLAENTIVAYTSDHGKHLGEYGCCEKASYDSEVWRVPFIMAGPGVPKISNGCSDLVEMMDLGPTLLSLAGLKPAKEMHGRDLFNSKEPEAVFGVIERGGRRDLKNPYAPQDQGFRRIAVRTKRFRYDYTYSLRGANTAKSPDEYDASLFDVQNDPLELNNLIHNPDYADIAKDMRQKGQQWYLKHLTTRHKTG